MKKFARQNLVKAAVPAEHSRNVKQVIKTMRAQAKDTLNLCNTTMLYKARDAFQKFVYSIASTADEIANKQGFIDILDKHATTAVIGAESRQQALRKCIREFNDKGIPAFVDRAGREWTPEAYVNMAMRSTSNTMAAEIQMARADDYGLDLVEVDSHSGARPKCARDQGKIFDRANKSKKYPHWNTSSYGEPDGLLGINCGHHIFPYMEGVSIRRYFPTEDMDANDKLYKEIQVQRALERDVRKQKRECMLYEELENKEAFEQAAVKLKQKESKLKAYVNGNDQLHRRTDREQVVGFDKRISFRAVAGNRKLQKGLAEKAKNDKIKAEIKAAGMRGEVELFPKDKIDVSGFAFDDGHINKEREHMVTRQEAERFILEADISVKKWDGRFVNYYGPNGAVFVDVENNNIRTAFRKEQYDERTKRMREVLKENGKG